MRKMYPILAVIIFAIILVSLKTKSFANSNFGTLSNFSMANLDKQKVMLFFVDPVGKRKPKNICENDACRSLLTLINNSKQSVDFAIYGIGGEDAIFNALVKAKQRGVKIRGVVDATQDNLNIYNDTDKLAKDLQSVKNDYFSPTKMANPNEKNFKFDITNASLETTATVKDILAKVKTKVKLVSDPAIPDASWELDKNFNVVILLNKL